MSTFKFALKTCGLSYGEAAEFFGVTESKIKDWCRNKTSPPPTVWEMLADLYLDIRDLSDHAAHIMDLEGIDFRSYNNIEVEAPEGLEFPNKSIEKMAGAKSLLRVLAAKKHGFEL